MWQEGSSPALWPLLIRALIPFLRALLSWPNDLPKAPPPNTIPLGTWGGHNIPHYTPDSSCLICPSASSGYEIAALLRSLLILSLGSFMHLEEPWLLGQTLTVRLLPFDSTLLFSYQRMSVLLAHDSFLQVLPFSPDVCSKYYNGIWLGVIGENQCTWFSHAKLGR